MANELITFILAVEHPTTYQKGDGSFHKQTVSKRIYPYYTRFNDDGEPVQYRHIRNEKSTELDKQSKNAVFNAKRDNIYFMYGFCVLHAQKDAVTIRFIREHPMNADVPDSQRRHNVIATFRELKNELAGLSEMDVLHLQREAENAIFSIQTGSKSEGYKYNMAKLGFMRKIFKIDGALESSQALVALVKKSKEAPQEFLYKLNSEWATIENEVETALNYDIIQFDKKTAFLNKEPMFVQDNPINEEGMKSEIIGYLLSAQGDDKYKEMKSSIEKANEREAAKPKKVKVAEPVPETA